MRKKDIKQKVYNYTAIFEPAEEGGYVVHVPALNGLTTEGDTLEEAEIMAKDVVQTYLEALKDLKEEIPFESKEAIITRIPVLVS